MVTVGRLVDIIWFVFIEYDALTRLGITDGKQFLKRRYKNNELFLPTCCVGQQLQDNVFASIDEGLSTTGWIDVMVSYHGNTQWGEDKAAVDSLQGGESDDW